MTQEQQADKDTTKTDMIEDPEFGMKDLTETLEQMAEEQQERLPEHGDAERAGEREA